MQGLHPAPERARQQPARERLLIAELDWERFSGYSKGRDCGTLFNQLDTFYRVVEERVVTTGGLVIEFLGDAAMVGEAVNIAFTLGHRGFVLSPQAFRSLAAETRKRFHKFTPPIVYMAS